MHITPPTEDRVARMLEGTSHSPDEVIEFIRVESDNIQCVISADHAIPESIPGKPPNLLNPPDGCRFSPRCTTGQASCETVEPPLVEVGPGHFVACSSYNAK